MATLKVSKKYSPQYPPLIGGMDFVDSWTKNQLIQITQFWTFWTIQKNYQTFKE